MTVTLSPEVQSLLQEAAEWRLLGLLFECPSPEWKQRIAALAAETAAGDLRESAAAALRDAAEEVFHSLLGPGGPAPGREASYRHSLELGRLMSELAACYLAFGYAPPAAEPPDHVSVEAGFMGYLRLKQACALACGETENTCLARGAAERFRRDHLSTVAQPLSESLSRSGEPYLDLAARALLRRTGPGQPLVFEILDENAGADDDELAPACMPEGCDPTRWPR